MNSKPAATAPMIGATINSQSCAIAVPPAKSAGPIERAGFTETPVTLMPTRWITTNARPMARPAIADGAPAPVDPRITTRNKKVATTSNTKAAAIVYSPR